MVIPSPWMRSLLIFSLVLIGCTSKKKGKESWETSPSSETSAASSGGGNDSEGPQGPAVPVSNLPEAKGTLVGAGPLPSGRWTAASSPYRVQGDLVLGPDRQLEIEAGVTVIFMGAYKFSIFGGRLLVRGTRQEPVRFTATVQTPGWYGILMCPDSNCNSEEARGQLDVDYAIFEYARANDRSGDFRYWRRGGAMLLLNPESIRLRRSIFRANHASEVGGALELIAVQNDKAVILENLSFQDNVAGSGGAIRLSHIHNRSWSGLTFERNRVLGFPDSYGGAIEADDVQNLTLTQVVFRDNEAQASGGAIYCYAPSLRLLAPYLLSGNRPEHSVGCGIETQIQQTGGSEDQVIPLDLPQG
jgi:predicted outer membrane repeat protein